MDPNKQNQRIGDKMHAIIEIIPFSAYEEIDNNFEESAIIHPEGRESNNLLYTNYAENIQKNCFNNLEYIDKMLENV